MPPSMVSAEAEGGRAEGDVGERAGAARVGGGVDVLGDLRKAEHEERDGANDDCAEEKLVKHSAEMRVSVRRDDAVIFERRTSCGRIRTIATEDRTLDEAHQQRSWRNNEGRPQRKVTVKTGMPLFDPQPSRPASLLSQVLCFFHGSICKMQMEKERKACVAGV